MDKITDRKITQSEFNTMASPLELDLISYFKLLEESVMKETFDEKQTPEQLIENILELLSPIVVTGAINTQIEVK